MIKIKKISFFLLGITLSFSCQESGQSKENMDSEENVNVVIDSSAFKLKKENYKIKSVIEEATISDQSTVKELVNSNSQESLSKEQKLIQSFLVLCAEKNYKEASKFLIYRGRDKSRNKKSSYNPNDSKELKIVSTTVDVIYTFLTESKEYKFAKVKEENLKIGTIKNVEVNFFKKSIGIDRHFFQVLDTPNGLLIYNMK